MNENEIKSEAEAILSKLEGINLPHVSDIERRAAVERAVKQLHVSARDHVKVLAELIDMNEEQLAVHEKASDTDDD